MPETASARFRRVYHGLSLLEPYDIKGKDKERIGRSGDGGYVLLKQQTPDVLYSFGVGPEITFEHILAERGTICYMFDHTIEAPPYTHDNFRYYREGVGAFDSAEGPIGTIDGFMRRHGDEGKNDILLKIDVEGAEYEIFDLIDESVLGRFTQIALEIHWLRNLTDPAFLERFIRMFEKLNKQFTLYHVHANNCAPPSCSSKASQSLTCLS